jgi:hypothetical protein
MGAFEGSDAENDDPKFARMGASIGPAATILEELRPAEFIEQ